MAAMTDTIAILLTITVMTVIIAMTDITIIYNRHNNCND